MSPSSKHPPPTHLLLHVDTTTNKSSAASSSSPHQGHHSSRPPRPPAASGGGGSSGSGPQNQACAACKYQRRKCNPDCPLAPYFPADQQRRFLNAHRLFGVSNIQKTLRRIDPEHGPAAMEALIFQSEARAADPVYGCVRIIKDLEHRIHLGAAQLEALRHQIAIYRQAAGPAMLQEPAAAPGQVDNAVMTMDALYGGVVPVHQEEPAAQAGGAGFAAVVRDGDDQDQPAQQIPLYDYFCYDGTGAGDEEATSHDATTAYDCYSDAGVKQTDGGSPQTVMTTLGEQLDQHCQIETAAAPFVDAFDEKPMAMEHHSRHGGGGVVEEQTEEKVVAAAVMKYDADHEMAEPAPAAAAQCHLELGFSF